MRYPHERYIRYLLSRRLNEYEVVAKCAEVGLVTPRPEDLQALELGLGPVPASWAPVLEVASVEFARWLRDKGVLDLWRAGPARDDAFRLLTNIHVRRAVEGVLLVDPDERSCRASLALTFAERELPSAQGIAVFRDFFWAFGTMTPKDAFDFAAEHQKDRAEVYYGLTRDAESTYGVLGLKRKVEESTFHDDLIAYAHQQLRRAAREGDVLEGKKQAGLAALLNAAQKSIESRSKLAGTADEGLMTKARAFKLARPSILPLRSIDDIQPPSGGQDAAVPGSDVAGAGGRRG